MDIRGLLLMVSCSFFQINLHCYFYKCDLAVLKNMCTVFLLFRIPTACTVQLCWAHAVFKLVGLENICTVYLLLRFATACTVPLYRHWARALFKLGGFEKHLHCIIAFKVPYCLHCVQLFSAHSLCEYRGHVFWKMFALYFASKVPYCLHCTTVLCALPT
jgi:hypothetical protein